jgi:hypothetical protein
MITDGDNDVLDEMEIDSEIVKDVDASSGNLVAYQGLSQIPNKQFRSGLVPFNILATTSSRSLSI